MRRDLPVGTVTFLFTDVEGSTRLLHDLGAERYAEALAEHRRVLREAFAAHGGVEVDTQGDAFFVAFPTAPGALAAAAQARTELAGGPISVRTGLHTGTPLVTEEGYVGADVHRAARIAAAGHGGQVLVSASTAPLVEAELVDLGPHRLKDLSSPERIYQLGEGEFPPLKSLYRTNLPIPATAFLGREDELAEVGALLAREDVRLLTLTGPGGAGKTRLALQAAADASDSYPDGVFWIPLAPLRDAALVMESAAQMLSAEDGLAEQVADKRLLLLFDNFEHVVQAANEVAELLASCPNLRILVTSRERLRVRGEHTWPVPPLAENDGAALFSARARAIDPTFAPSPAVNQLCAHLDELPLAIELAAARTALFAPEQLLERLTQRLDLLKGDRDADPRQQTLRATIAWSYDLLTGEEQALFRYLSIFVGGCTYEGAERVAGTDPDTLQSLLDKSLLRKRDSPTGEPRYWMLETVREYAAEQLEAAGEEHELGERHSAHFLALAAEADPFLRLVALRGVVHGPAEWLDRLEAEHDNLRAVLDRLEATGETQRALQLAGNLAEFWYFQNHYAEGGRRVEAALARDSAPTAARAKALVGAADLAMTLDDRELSLRRAEEALRLYRALGDDRGTADALWRIGAAATVFKDWAGALAPLTESVALFERIGDESQLGVLRTLAWTYANQGDLQRAAVLYADVVDRARARGNTYWETVGIRALSFVAVEDGRIDDALELLRENLPLFVIGRDTPLLMEHLCHFAEVLAAAGDAAIAVTLVAACQATGEEVDVTVHWVQDSNEKTLRRAREQLEPESFAEAWEHGRTLTADDAIALARDAVVRARRS